MSSQKLRRTASHTAVGLCLIALLSRSAEAQQRRWFGSATCDVTTTATNYSDTQRHEWHILPFRTTSGGSSTYYSLIWTVTGHGSSGSDGSNATNQWTYEGLGFQALEFFVTATDPDHLRVSEGLHVCDTSGVHPRSGGTGQICEYQFAAGHPPIIVDKMADKRTRP